MAYLIKVSLAWTLFLLLFELVFRHNGKFTANRLYLVFSLLAGLIIPIIPMPFALA
ncbi:MAG: energy transducer TonB, partial [Chitinophagaceae bacterium]